MLIACDVSGPLDSLNERTPQIGLKRMENGSHCSGRVGQSIYSSRNSYYYVFRWTYKEGWKWPDIFYIVFGLESRKVEINTEVIICGGVIQKMKGAVSLPPHPTFGVKSVVTCVGPCIGHCAQTVAKLLDTIETDLYLWGFTKKPLGRCSIDSNTVNYFFKKNWNICAECLSRDTRQSSLCWVLDLAHSTKYIFK